MRNISKIIEECINSVVSEAILRSHPWVDNVSILDRMENLGFQRCLTQKDYDGNFDIRRLTYRIPLEKWTVEIEKQLQTVLNFYGYFLSSKNKGSNMYDGSPVMYVSIETVYGNQENTLDTYYHATPERKVTKILRQGLIPKSSDPMRKNAPSRIYLCKEIDEYLFRARCGDDYKIFKVDLSAIKNKIKVYTDNLADGNSVYTYDYIPPQCLSIIGRPSDKLKEDISKIAQLINDKICSNINGLKIINVRNLVGSFENENKGTNVELSIHFGDLAGYYNLSYLDSMDRLGLEGYKLVTYPNGRKRRIILKKNFNNVNVPNKIRGDLNAKFNYLAEKMVDYLFKWILS